jgi:MFS family permease
VSAPFVGWAFDRFSVRRLMLIGIGMLCAGFVTLSQASATWQVVLVFGFLLALSLALLRDVPTMTLLSLMTPPPYLDSCSSEGWEVDSRHRMSSRLSWSWDLANPRA